MIGWKPAFFIAGAGLAAALAQPSACETDVADYEVENGFHGEGPADLSGIACIPANQRKAYRCLVVNDETQTAQFARVEDGKIEAGEEIRLIGESPDPETVGARPRSVPCPKITDDFEELDGEGVAYAAPYFYVVGSHGCSRKNGKFRLSTFILARIRVDQEGRPVDAAGNVLTGSQVHEAVETTYRLSDLLPRATEAGAFFGKELDEETKGLNIEGIAVQGENIFVGLRAPSIEGRAFIVRANVDELLRAGREPAPATALIETIPVALGPDVGIRDLAPLPDGRLLILAGAAYGDEIPYSIFVVDSTGANLQELLPPQSDQPTRAEGMTVLEATDKEIRLLILFDKADRAPQEVRIQH
jgi:Protein of unknown function (DUF3616)/Family of unknown function (DUF6910)